MLGLFPQPAFTRQTEETKSGDIGLKDKEAALMAVVCLVIGGVAGAVLAPLGLLLYALLGSSGVPWWWFPVSLPVGLLVGAIPGAVLVIGIRREITRL